MCSALSVFLVEVAEGWILTTPLEAIDKWLIFKL